MSAPALTVARAAHAVIDKIRRHVAVRKEVLKAAKERRDLVRDLAVKHPAARAGFNSGSVAHGTANAPLNDTDCGVVLDRRKFPEYGPCSDVHFRERAAAFRAGFVQQSPSAAGVSWAAARALACLSKR